MSVQCAKSDINLHLILAKDRKKSDIKFNLSSKP